MIKAGIIGGSNPMAGELIRLLINHPDVEIMWVDSARYTGRLVSDVHHGLIGETQLRISPSSSNLLDSINVLFIFRHKGQTLEWLEERDIPENLRIVDMSVDMRDPENAEKHNFVYGLPELNRKAMVRGAKRAIVPHPAAIIAELSLLPLAKEEALKDAAIEAVITLPEDSEPVESETLLAQEIARALRELQTDYTETPSIKMEETSDERVMTSTLKLNTKLDIGEVMRLYEEFYDDHNFIFMVNEKPEPIEVAGTNKCLIYLEKHEGSVLEIASCMDAILKGAAGTAVHDMNLLFGLHERVGLALKAAKY